MHALSCNSTNTQERRDREAAEADEELKARVRANRQQKKLAKK